MKQDLSLWQFAGFSLTSLSGTFLHFLYDWTNQNVLVAPFTAINESTWEHMKLIYFPLVIFSFIQGRSFKKYKNFWCVKLKGILTSLTLIPTLFYTYNGIFGRSPDWINIAIFFISVGVAFLDEWKLFKNNEIRCKRKLLPLFFILLPGVFFIVFTFTTPQIPLFQDPLTGTYGLQ